MQTFPVLGSMRCAHHLREASVIFMVVGVPLELMRQYERRLMLNHHKSLDQVIEEGGLHANQIIAILEDRDWDRKDEDVDVHRSLTLIVSKWLVEQRNK